MPQLLMVSRTPSLAMGLAGTAFDVVVLSPNEARRGDGAAAADAVLIDVQSTQDALLVLEQLRDPLEPIPALVLAGPDWDCAPFEELPFTSVVVRPVSQRSLVTLLDGMLAPDTPHGDEPPLPDLEMVPEAVPPPIPRSTPTVETAPVVQQASPKVVEEPKPRRRDSSPIDLVRALLPHTDQLPWVPETSHAVLAHALVVAAADAGVVLIRDGDRWVVTAGSGLRPLELRSELGPEHWVVDTVCGGQRGVLVQDSDIARSHLAGAPLASWRNLVAVPVALVDGIIMLARRDDPMFTESDLKRLATLSQEASSALAEAIEVHRLAHALARYLEPTALDS
jgi:hypothetical protein